MSQTLRSRFAALSSKRSAIGLGLAAMVIAGSTQASADPTSPEGYWYTKGNESIIKFQPCKQSFCGSVVWLKDPVDTTGAPFTDLKNPDATKRTRPMIGLEIFNGLTPVDDHWKGKAYNADDGKTYDITFTVKTDKEPNDKADVRGCILGFLCGTETFTRTADVPGGDPTAVASTAAAKAKGHPPVKKDTAKK